MPIGTEKVLKKKEKVTPCFARSGLSSKNNLASGLDFTARGKINPWLLIPGKYVTTQTDSSIKKVKHAVHMYRDEEVVQVFLFLFCLFHIFLGGGGRGYGGSRIDADIQSRPITYHEGKPDSSCVVAIKMRSLYFVTLKNFYICV